LNVFWQRSISVITTGIILDYEFANHFHFLVLEKEQNGSVPILG